MWKRGVGSSSHQAKTFANKFSINDVKRAYKRLTPKYHPEVIRGEMKKEKEALFKEIETTYESMIVKLEGESENYMTCVLGDLHE